MDHEETTTYYIDKWFTIRSCERSSFPDFCVFASFDRIQISKFKINQREIGNSVIDKLQENLMKINAKLE
jgi:hypothetical protein